MAADHEKEKREKAEEEKLDKEAEEAQIKSDAGATEETIFKTDCKLWKLVKDATTSENPSPNASDATARAESTWRWQERGCGNVHVYKHKTTGEGRLVMRLRGVLKLLLNTPIIPTTKYEKVGQKSVRFVGIDDGVEPLCAYRLNLHSGDQQQKFITAVQGCRRS